MPLLRAVFHCCPGSLPLLSSGVCGSDRGAMSIKLNIQALHETHWYEYGSRFLFGGTATVITGLIARKFGPSVGGLFLAFPAIFPASASLVEKHERQKK